MPPFPRRAADFLAAVICIILLAVPLAARGEEQDFVYAIHLDDMVLSESMAVLERNGDILLPLAELSSLLSLAIHYDGAGTASGYIMDEARTININAVKGIVSIRGDSANFDPGLALAQKDDLFIASRVLSDWLPISIIVDRNQQLINLVSREKLPLQQLLERRALFQKLPKNALDNDPSFPDVTPPYRLLSVPMVDFSSSVDFSGRNLGTVQNRQSIMAAGDLAALTASVNLSDSNGTLDRADLALGRTDSKGELLGALQATRFTLGAVQTPAFAGISRVSDPMYGFVVSNRPTQLPSQFSSHDITGPIVQGWDAELYYNGVPIGYQPASKDTIYRFTNLPLKVGLNDFRVIMHGPNGETRIENQRFLLDNLLVQPGKIQYTLGGNRELIKNNQSATGIMAFDIGLTKNLSGFVGGFSEADSHGRFSHYAGVGLKGTLGASFTTLDHVRSSDRQGSATLFTVKGYSSGYYLSASQAFLDNFSSDNYQIEPDPLASTTSIKVEGSLPLPVRMPFGLESILDLRRSGNATPTFVGRLSGEFYRIGISEQVTSRLLKDSAVTIGLTQIGTQFKDLSLRGQVSYNLSPAVSVTSIQLTATQNIGNDFKLNGQVSHNPATSTYDFTAGVAKRIGDIGLTLNAGASTAGTYSISSQLSVSAGLNPRSSKIIADPFPMSSFGGIAIRVYVDSNGNGIYDPGERSLEGIRFLVNGGATLQATDKDGNLLLRQIPAGIPTDISIVQDSVSEPFLVPLATGYRIESRPGVIARLDFVFVPSGEVDGVVMLKTGDRLGPVSGVNVALVDSRHNVVAKAASDQSGYFLFKKVKGGRYNIVLADGEGARLKISQLASVEVNMPMDGDMLGNNDLIIERQN